MVIDKAMLDVIDLYDERFPHAGRNLRAKDLDILIKGLSKYGMPYVRGVLDVWSWRIETYVTEERTEVAMQVNPEELEPYTGWEEDMKAIYPSLA